jgi:hypothetical protein
MGGAADKAGNRFERRWTLLALLDLLTGKAQSLQVEVPGDKGAGAEFLQVMTDGVPVWHQVKRQQASGSWTIRALVRKKVVAPWWPKISSGGRFVFVSSTSAQELAELVERASTAESWQVFDEHFLTVPHRDRFERLRQAWGNPPGAEVYAALRHIEVRQIGEPDLKDLLETRLGALVDGAPSTAVAVLEQFIDESTHRPLTAPDVWRRLAESGLQPAGPGNSGGEHGPQAPSGQPALQMAEGSGSTQITQVAGNYINIQAASNAHLRHRRNSPKRNQVLLAFGGATALIAVVAAIVAFSGDPGSSRLPVQPLTGQSGTQLDAVRIPVASLQGTLAKMFGQGGGTTAETITGYEFRNAWNESAPVCLGAMDTGPTAQDYDPVQVLSCSEHAQNEIWVPAQWEQDHQELTWLVNLKYQSMCLNVDMNAGRGTQAKLWDCYRNSGAPYGLAINEAWDFGAWYNNVKSGVNPYPIFLGSSDFCLDADRGSADQSTNNQLPDNTEVTMWDYYHVTRNQYWS